MCKCLPFLHGYWTRAQEYTYSADATFATKPGHALSAEEKHVIDQNGTEQAGTGTYNKFYPGQGYFACRKCGSPIYSAQAKFDSGCGWPAFDKCFTGAIKMRRELNGRVEIMCTCGAHLGHVFDGEGFTEENQRHCANSRSLQYVKAKPAGELTETKLDTASALGQAHRPSYT
ncbi:hypothetical protein CYMTET_17077 [Cymbomonas tetramitiformis]|uniref:MsrB domain-containing protein n=1 Tax=Cymbomonas tetramitiformis TaxID=36881 RepID=A0AAE0GAW3_9CHLO|nr:hypothetical protein CYMTET_17077 [Cymbomonas tetramitiformis]